jgi:predicted dehydrogenase
VIAARTGSIRVGILGTARIAPLALVGPARQTPGIVVDAIASRTRSKAESFAARHGIARVFASYDALIRDRRVDAVYIALPTALHCEWTLRALDAGKHVLCEKPLASDAASASRMADAAAASRRVLQEGLHMRFLATLRRQKALVDSGRIGVVRRVNASCCLNIPIPSDDFRLRPELGGGAGLDLGCYAVSLFRFIAGEEPTVVSARATRSATADVDASMHADLRTPSGIAGMVECAFEGITRPRFGVAVEGDRGWLGWSADGLVGQRGDEPIREVVAPTPTYRLQLEAFATQIAGEPCDAPGAADAVATARVIDAMYAHAGFGPRAACMAS